MSNVQRNKNKRWHKLLAYISQRWGVNLHGANLYYADLRDTDLTWANLQDADLRYADLTWANLRDADLTWAKLRDADLQNAKLEGANLRDADLYKAKLQNANLRDADLTWANLRDADLECADLQYADLQNAKLYGANLEGANLTGAIVSFPVGMSSRNDDLAIKISSPVLLIAGCWEGDVFQFIERINQEKEGRARLAYLARALSLVAMHGSKEEIQTIQDAITQKGGYK